MRNIRKEYVKAKKVMLALTLKSEHLLSEWSKHYVVFQPKH